HLLTAPDPSSTHPLSLHDALPILAGHSAGGWSALMATLEYGDQFNGVIAFAPAFAGRRSEVLRYPRWRRKIRPQQIEHLLQAKRDRKSTRLNSSHVKISYAVFCLK